MASYQVLCNVTRPPDPTSVCRVSDLQDKVTRHLGAVFQDSSLSSGAISSGEDGLLLCALVSKLSASFPGADNFESQVKLPFFWCDLCPFETESKATLLQHTVQQHCFVCRYCSFVALSRTSVVQHSTSQHHQFQQQFRAQRLKVYQLKRQEFQNYFQPSSGVQPLSRKRSAQEDAQSHADHVPAKHSRRNSKDKRDNQELKTDKEGGGACDCENESNDNLVECLNERTSGGEDGKTAHTSQHSSNADSEVVPSAQVLGENVVSSSGMASEADAESSSAGPATVGETRSAARPGNTPGLSPRPQSAVSDEDEVCEHTEDPGSDLHCMEVKEELDVIGEGFGQPLGRSLPNSRELARLLESQPQTSFSRLSRSSPGFRPASADGPLLVKQEPGVLAENEAGTSLTHHRCTQGEIIQQIVDTRTAHSPPLSSIRVETLQRQFEESFGTQPLSASFSSADPRPVRPPVPPRRRSLPDLVDNFLLDTPRSSSHASNLCPNSRSDSLSHSFQPPESISHPPPLPVGGIDALVFPEGSPIETASQSAASVLRHLLTRPYNQGASSSLQRSAARDDSGETDKSNASGAYTETSSVPSSGETSREPGTRPQVSSAPQNFLLTGNEDGFTSMSSPKDTGSRSGKTTYQFNSLSKEDNKPSFIKPEPEDAEEDVDIEIANPSYQRTAFPFLESQLNVQTPSVSAAASAAVPASTPTATPAATSTPASAALAADKFKSYSNMSLRDILTMHTAIDLTPVNVNNSIGEPPPASVSEDEQEEADEGMVEWECGFCHFTAQDQAVVLAHRRERHADHMAEAGFGGERQEDVAWAESDEEEEEWTGPAGEWNEFKREAGEWTDSKCEAEEWTDSSSKPVQEAREWTPGPRLARERSDSKPDPEALVGSWMDEPGTSGSRTPSRDDAIFSQHVPSPRGNTSILRDFILSRPPLVLQRQQTSPSGDGSRRRSARRCVDDDDDNEYLSDETVGSESGTEPEDLKDESYVPPKHMELDFSSEDEELSPEKAAFGVLRGRPPLGSRGRPPLSSRGRPPLGSRGRPPLGSRGRPPLGSRGRPPFGFGSRSRNSRGRNGGGQGGGSSVDDGMRRRKEKTDEAGEEDMRKEDADRRFLCVFCAQPAVSLREMKHHICHSNSASDSRHILMARCAEPPRSLHYLCPADRCTRTFPDCRDYVSHVAGCQGRILDLQEGSVRRSLQRALEKVQRVAGFLNCPVSNCYSVSHSKEQMASHLSSHLAQVHASQRLLFCSVGSAMAKLYSGVAGLGCYLCFCCGRLLASAPEALRHSRTDHGGTGQGALHVQQRLDAEGRSPGIILAVYCLRCCSHIPSLDTWFSHTCSQDPSNSATCDSENIGHSLGLDVAGKAQVSEKNAGQALVVLSGKAGNVGTNKDNSLFVDITDSSLVSDNADNDTEIAGQSPVTENAGHLQVTENDGNNALVSNNAGRSAVLVNTANALVAEVTVAPSLWPSYKGHLGRSDMSGLKNTSANSTLSKNTSAHTQVSDPKGEPPRRSLDVEEETKTATPPPFGEWLWRMQGSSTQIVPSNHKLADASAAASPDGDRGGSSSSSAGGQLPLIRSILLAEPSASVKEVVTGSVANTITPEVKEEDDDDDVTTLIQCSGCQELLTETDSKQHKCLAKTAKAATKPRANFFSPSPSFSSSTFSQIGNNPRRKQVLTSAAQRLSSPLGLSASGSRSSEHASHSQLLSALACLHQNDSTSNTPGGPPIFAAPCHPPAPPAVVVSGRSPSSTRPPLPSLPSLTPSPSLPFSSSSSSFSSSSSAFSSHPSLLNLLTRKAANKDSRPRPVATGLAACGDSCSALSTGTAGQPSLRDDHTIQVATGDVRSNVRPSPGDDDNTAQPVRDSGMIRSLLMGSLVPAKTVRTREFESMSQAREDAGDATTGADVVRARNTSSIGVQDRQQAPVQGKLAEPGEPGHLSLLKGMLGKESESADTRFRGMSSSGMSSSRMSSSGMPSSGMPSSEMPSSRRSSSGMPSSGISSSGMSSSVLKRMLVKNSESAETRFKVISAPAMPYSKLSSPEMPSSGMSSSGVSASGGSATSAPLMNFLRQQGDHVMQVLGSALDDQDDVTMS